MCYNCGCNMPDDDMGVGHACAEPDGKSITNKTFEELSKKWSISSSDAKKLVLEMLKGENKDSEKAAFMDHLYKEAAESQGMSEEEAKKETLKLLKQTL